MFGHRSAIVTDQHAARDRGDFENFRIGKTDNSAVSGGSKLDHWFASPDRDNDIVIQIRVGLKSDQGRGSLILARARCSLSQSAGLASESGTVLASNSRSLSSRYLSISGL